MSRLGAHADEETMSIMPLGGGQEVGRSSILLQFRGRNILLDCGTHPGREGIDSLPFFDSLDDPGSIDLILVTHFHIDHCAALPYFTEKTNFRGRIFMTHATKAVMRMLLSDNIKLQTRTRPLYSEQELQNCIEKIEVVDFHQTIEHKGIKFTPTAAGHVLGAAMFTIEIDGIRVLYTGDYSMEADRHLASAEVPRGGPPDVLIVESTFGVVSLPSREDRESRFTATVEDIVTRGGSCLIPVFALGRAQELLLILDEYWQAHPELQTVPVFYASKLASKALRVYQTFVNMMNERIRTLMDVANPFKLKHVQNMMRSDFDHVGACVVMAAPGFLQTGVSRHLFERWCDDDRNGVIIAGYTVEGTLAHDLLSAPTEIPCTDNRIKPRRCQIEFISFSAHVDYTQNSQFIRRVLPDNIILVHGERNGMKRLKDSLERDINKGWPVTHKPPVAMPDNGIRVKLRFNKPIVADILGSAAQEIVEQLDDTEKTGIPTTIPESSLLVMENFVSKVVKADELSKFTSLRLAKIKHRIIVPLPLGLDLGILNVKGSLSVLSLLVPFLDEVFDEVAPGEGFVEVQSLVKIIDGLSSSSTTTTTSKSRSAIVPGAVGVGGGSGSGGFVIVEWSTSPMADLVADCAIGIVHQAFSAPNILRYTMALASAPLSKAATPASSVDGLAKKTDPAALSIPGGLWASGLGRRKRCKHSLTGFGDSSCVSVSCSGEGKNADGCTVTAPVGQDKERDDVLKRMKLGLVDPSKTIPADAIALSSAATAVEGAEFGSIDGTVKLQRLQQSLILVDSIRDSKLFESIKLNADGTKLIFRSADSPGVEAYSFILWGTPEEVRQAGDGPAQHHAVVTSEDEEFRKIVIQAIIESNSN